MATEDIGTLRGKIELENKGHAPANEFLRDLGNIKSAAAGVALGMIGANGLSAALSTVFNGVKANTKAFIDFKERMAEVSTLVDISVVNMQELESGVVTLARRYGKDAGGLANALYQTISAGVEAGDAMKFLELSTKAAVGGVTSTLTAVDALTSAMNSYGMTMDEVTDASDSLFLAVKWGKTTLQELNPEIGQVAPLAHAAGISFDEMTSALAALTLGGKTTSEAGTGLQAILRELIKPSDEAMKIAKALNIEWGVNGVKAAGGLGNWLKILKERTGGSVEVMGKLFQEVRGMGAALTLTGPIGDKFNVILKDMGDKAGATDTAFSKMNATTLSWWGRVKQTFAHPISSVAELADAIAGVDMEQKALQETEKKSNKTKADYNTLIDESKAKIVDLEEKQTEIENRKKTGAVLIDQMLEKMNGNAIARVKSYIATENEKIEGYNAEIKKLQELADKKTKTEAMMGGKPLTPGGKTGDAVLKALEETERQKKLDELDKKLKAERLQRIRELAEVEADTDNRIYESRANSLKEQAELLDDEAKKETNTYDAQLRAAVKASETRITLYNVERAYAEQESERKMTLANETADLTIAKTEEEKAARDAALEAAMANYAATSDQIKSDFETKLTKELVVRGEVQVKLNQSMFERLWTNMNNNFKKWMEDLKSGSTAAWSGVITDTTSGIVDIGKAFGGMNDRISSSITDLGNALSAVLAGNPISALFSGLKFIGDALGLAGDNSREAAKQEAEAAMQALQAAKAFLKASGKEDLQLDSYDELNKKLEDASATLGNTLQTGYGLSLSQFNAVQTAVNEAQAQGLSGKAAGSYIAGRYSALTGEDILHAGRAIAAYGAATSDATVQGLVGRVGTLSNAISAFNPNATPSLAAARTYSDAKTTLDIQRSKGLISDYDYWWNLKDYLENKGGWQNLNAQELQNERVAIAAGLTAAQPTAAPIAPSGYSFDGGGATAAAPTDDYAAHIAGKQAQWAGVPQLAGGGIAMRPALANIGEGGTPEAVIPLDRLGEVMGMVHSRSGGGGGSQTIHVALELDGQVISEKVLEIGGNRYSNTARVRGMN